MRGAVVVPLVAWLNPFGTIAMSVEDEDGDLVLKVYEQEDPHPVDRLIADSLTAVLGRPWRRQSAGNPLAGVSLYAEYRVGKASDHVPRMTPGSSPHGGNGGLTAPA